LRNVCAITVKEGGEKSAENPIKTGLFYCANDYAILAALELANAAELTLERHLFRGT
jgi:hypothetical protein